MSIHEIPHTKVVKKKGNTYYLAHYKEIHNELNEKDIAFTSEKTMTKKQLQLFLKEQNYFKPKTTQVNFPKILS